MTTPLTVVYSDTYLDWQLGSGNGTHPTNPVRAQLATNLLVDRLGDSVRIVDPVAKGSDDSDRAILDTVHDRDFVARTLGGDNPEWVGTNTVVAAAGFAMFRGTIRAVEAILSGAARVVFNPQGAKHHARFDRGSGFCVFNDMAYAAQAFAATGLKPLYIDWDIHAGDGVFHMLKGTGIPTISIHEGNIYPGDRELQSLDGTRSEVIDTENHGYGLNLVRGDGDEHFMRAIDRAAQIIDDYQPDVILLAAGADGHTGTGNLGQIANFTSAGFDYAARMIADKATRYAEGRVLIGGAGGYQPLHETPETWAQVVATIYTNTLKEDDHDAR